MVGVGLLGCGLYLARHRRSRAGSCYTAGCFAVDCGSLKRVSQQDNHVTVWTRGPLLVLYCTVRE
jgi:hypothetical protein